MDNINDFYFLFKLLIKLFNEINSDESNNLENHIKIDKIFSDFMNELSFYITKNHWNENDILKIPVQELLEIMIEYLNNTQLDYFSIPVIGTISSGKSTFLNSLLGLDCLESDIKITTKFICIIRHNPELSAPKLFPVFLEKRRSEANKNAYNFIKDEKNELKGDLKKNIHEINQKITECKDLKNLKKEEFFYILEANLDIFKGRNYIFSKSFEFIDLPGINEITEFYLKNIIPLITPNIYFSIFLFDAIGCEDLDTLKLFKYFIDFMNSKAKNNSFLICNILDIFGKDKFEENRQIIYFKNEILKNYNKEINNDHIVLLDPIQLKYDKNKNKYFSDYIRSFIQSIPERKQKRFELLFKKKLKEDFNISKFPKKDDNENKSIEDEILLNDINDALLTKRYDEIDISFLLQMKNIYNEKKNNNSQIKGNIKDENNKYEKLYNLLNKSFTDTIDEFVLKNNLLFSIKAFNSLLFIFYELSQNKAQKEYIKHAIYYCFSHWENTLYPLILMAKINKNKQKIKPILNEFFYFLGNEKSNNNQVNQYDKLYKKNFEKKISEYEKKSLELEKKNKELAKKNKDLNEELKKEIENNKKKDNKVKELNEEIKKEKKISKKLKERIIELEKFENTIKSAINNPANKILDLMEELEKKENEVKELKSTSLISKEKLINIIFVTREEDIYWSISSQKNIKFNILENSFFEKYPELLDYDIYYFCRDRKINRYKSIEENNINHNDIISIIKTNK